MDKSQARLVLGLDLHLEPDSEVLKDTFEEAVFKEVTFFMRRSFLPVLARKCIKKLHDIDLAGKVLGLRFDLSVKDQNLHLDFQAEDNLLSLLSAYHSHESNLKSNLVNSTAPLEAVSIYHQWISLFESFTQTYIRIFENLNVDTSLVDRNEIRIAEAIDFNDLYKELKSLKYSNLACKEYCRLHKLMTYN